MIQVMALCTAYDATSRRPATLANCAKKPEDPIWVERNGAGSGADRWTGRLLGSPGAPAAATAPKCLDDLHLYLGEMTHAARLWPRSISSGSSSAQMSCAFQHRVRNRHPDTAG